MRFFLCLCFCMFSVAPAMNAASFDCARAQSVREKNVCADRKLSAADSRLGELYDSLRKKLSPDARIELQQDQLQWLKATDMHCAAQYKNISPEDCLGEDYAARIASLNDSRTLASGHLLFWRDAAYTIPHTVKPSDEDFDPGYGYGSYSYPEVDTPNGEEQAFNVAMKQVVLRMASPESNKVPASFRDAVDSMGSLEITGRVLGTNSSIIEVDLEGFSYGWGAAHPSTGFQTLTWLLDKQRELTPNDIFRDGSGWQDVLGPMIADKVQQSLGSFPIWQGKDRQIALEQIVKQPRQWRVSRSGVVFKFQQYQIAAYVAGLPEASFTWKELRPYLNPGVQPEQFPTLAKAQE